MQATNHTRIAALPTALVAVILIAAATLTPANEASVAAPVAKAEAQATIVGTFTGEFDNGVPIYRLPAVAVTTRRSAELAKMAREEQFAMK